MELSILLAKIFSAVYLAAGLGVLLNPRFYSKIMDDMLKNVAVTFIYGFFAIIFGVFMVTYHNFWVKDWTVAITIIGWASLIKGFMFLVLPQTIKFARPMYYSRYFAIAALAIAIFFGYYGFFANII
jgi:hypothetical protein